MSTTAPPSSCKSVRPGGASRWRVFPLALVLVLGACALKDLTDPPSWSLRLNFPVTTSSIGVSSMLPTGVALNTAGSAFLVTAPAAGMTKTLGESCSACVALNGLLAPKPAFTSTQSAASALPANVTTATLASGSIVIAIANGFGFDPLQVAGAATNGTIVTTVVDANGRQLAKDSVNGATTTLAGGTTLNRSLSLAAGLLRGPLTVTAVVTSPAGGATTINTSQIISVTGTPQNITVSSAQVTIANQQVTSAGTALDLSDVGSGISQRITAATIFVGLANPFGVTGTLNLRFQGQGVDFTKSLALSAGASTPTVTLNTSEIDATMGKNITLTASGTVSATAPVSVAPTDKVTITPRLEVTLSTEKR